MMRGVNTRSGLMERHMAGGCRCGKIEDEDEEDEEERNVESGRRRGEKMQHTKQHNQPHTVTSDQHRLEKTTFPQMQLQKDILDSAQHDCWRCRGNPDEAGEVTRQRATAAQGSCPECQNSDGVEYP